MKRRIKFNPAATFSFSFTFGDFCAGGAETAGERRFRFCDYVKSLNVPFYSHSTEETDTHSEFDVKRDDRQRRE